ncbi:class I SAM-dependent methyltransferase [Kordiimonas sp.]|uniref:class I SAM-dependent methyltransferase n=1 Tax=Kordiimonas sp. TaxID=1970157 RepID=UPI003A8F025F
MDGSFQASPAPITTLTNAEKILSIVFARLQTGSLEVTFPSGAKRTFTGTEQPDAGRCSMHIVKWSAISRIIKRGAIGLAEAFIEGEWITPDLTKLLNLLAVNMSALEQRSTAARLWQLFDKVGHFRNRNTRLGSRRNISFHYDLGNDFYQLWLDPSMTYSAALFTDKDLALEQAQRQKYTALADELGLKKGDHVLEIGCGWGGFAEYAAGELGCRVTGVTLSQEQLKYAEARILRAGLASLVDLQLCDYRDIEGQFDHIVSIEMLEAVGESYWVTYFAKVKSALKPGGKAGIQVITIDDQRFETYRHRVDFIQRYIFPGGMLPSDSVLREKYTEAGLRLYHRRNFGLDYAKTLNHWHVNFEAATQKVLELGFDQRFLRLWKYYLSYCEAGFRQRTIDVTHYVLG